MDSSASVETHHDPHSHASEHEHHELGFWRKYIFSTDHKVIGIQYGLCGLAFLFLGFCLMMLMRWQLAYPGQALPVIAGMHALELVQSPHGSRGPELLLGGADHAGPEQPVERPLQLPLLCAEILAQLGSRPSSPRVVVVQQRQDDRPFESWIARRCRLGRFCVHRSHSFRCRRPSSRRRAGSPDFDRLESTHSLERFSTALAGGAGRTPKPESRMITPTGYIDEMFPSASSDTARGG